MRPSHRVVSPATRLDPGLKSNLRGSIHKNLTNYRALGERRERDTPDRFTAVQQERHFMEAPCQSNRRRDSLT